MVDPTTGPPLPSFADVLIHSDRPRLVDRRTVGEEDKMTRMFERKILEAAHQAIADGEALDSRPGVFRPDRAESDDDKLAVVHRVPGEVAGAGAAEDDEDEDDDDWYDDDDDDSEDDAGYTGSGDEVEQDEDSRDGISDNEDMEMTMH